MERKSARIRSHFKGADHHLIHAIFLSNIWGDPKGPWHYKLLDAEGIRQTGRSKYEEFGNFNFGATGAATGIPTGALLRGAGLVQQQDPNPDVRGRGQGVPVNSWPEIFSNKGTYPYGDEPSDSAAIQRGVDYYNCRQKHPR